MEQVEVVLASNDRVTLRLGDVFLRIDADQSRTDVEVEAMAIAPVPTADGWLMAVTVDEYGVGWNPILFVGMPRR